MDREGDVDKRADKLGSTRAWGVNEPLKPKELSAAVGRLREISRGEHSAGNVRPAEAGAVSTAALKDVLSAANPKWVSAIKPAEIANPSSVTAGEFARIAARILML
jgi:hypothetical protein